MTSKALLSIILLTFCVLLPITMVAQSDWHSQSEWKSFFDSKLDDISHVEGIWSVSLTINGYNNSKLIFSKNLPQFASVAVYYDRDGKYKVDLIQDDDRVDLHGISFEKTATSHTFLMRKSMKLSRTSVRTYVTLPSAGFLKFSYDEPVEETKAKFGRSYVRGANSSYDHNWIKVYPDKATIERAKAVKEQASSVPETSSGTGFAVSSLGYIVTNYHVVEGASNITVKGLKSDFHKPYQANVVVVDKNNDLALLKIINTEGLDLGEIPYVLNSKLAKVGEDVFVLGYPLRATMGDEIKLTNGIVSSKTGFQGDVSSYQISAPVQPGNSGGPVFNKNGELIAVINAKHLQAENATYAVKISYLVNLFELVDDLLMSAGAYPLKGKALSEQVEKLNDFVYIIEAR